MTDVGASSSRFGLLLTTRFIGILVSVAALGAVLSNVARNAFVTTAVVAGLDPTVAEVAAKRVTTGDLPVPNRVTSGLSSQ